MLLIPVHGRQMKTDLYEFKCSLVYIVSQSYIVRLCVKNKIQH